MVEKNSYIYEYVPKYVFYIILILTIILTVLLIFDVHKKIEYEKVNGGLIPVHITQFKVVIIECFIGLLIIASLIYVYFQNNQYKKTVRNISHETINIEEIDLVNLKIVSSYLEFYYREGNFIKKKELPDNNIEIIEHDSPEIKLEYKTTVKESYKCYGDQSEEDCGLAYDDYQSFDFIRRLVHIFHLFEEVSDVNKDINSKYTLYIPAKFDINKLYEGINLN